MLQLSRKNIMIKILKSLRIFYSITVFASNQHPCKYAPLSSGGGMSHYQKTLFYNS